MSKRRIKIKEDKQLQDLIDKKYKLIKEANKNVKKANKLQERNQEISNQLSPIKKKLNEMMDEKFKELEEQGKTKEFELPFSTEKKGKGYYMVINNEFDNFKEQFKKQKYGNQQGSDKTNNSN